MGLGYGFHAKFISVYNVHKSIGNLYHFIGLE